MLAIGDGCPYAPKREVCDAAKYETPRLRKTGAQFKKFETEWLRATQNA
jgi:hypothetical protein